MQNGDNYYGTVLSLDAQTLVLQSENLGTLRLARNRLAGVTFGSFAKFSLQSPSIRTNPVTQSLILSRTNSPSELAGAFRQLGANTNLLQQVEAQFLTDGGPQAKEKFNQLMGGLIGGKLNLDDIRAEAQSALDQARAAKKDLGEDAGSTMDGYLAILDSFLKETAPAGAGNTNAIALPPKAASGAAPE